MAINQSELWAAMPQMFDLNYDPVSRAYNEPQMNEADRLMVLTSNLPAAGKLAFADQMGLPALDGMDAHNQMMKGLSEGAGQMLNDMAYQGVRDAMVIRAFNDERDALNNAPETEE